MPLPLYYRIREYLQQLIDSGALQPGDRIPTEEQLSEQFRVSRMTARRAVTDLAREGRLVRRQGLGTFVSEPRISRQLARLTTLSEEMEQRGYTGLRSQLLAWRELRAAPAVAEKFQIRPGDPVLRISRVRYTADIPIALQVFYFPGAMMAGLQPADLTGPSLYKLFEERFHYRIGWADQRIEAIAAPRFQARWLQIDPGSPVLRVNKRGYLEDGRLMELTRTYYRADRYSFQIKLYRHHNP